MTLMKAYRTALPSFRREWGLEGALESGTSPELGWLGSFCPIRPESRSLSLSLSPKVMIASFLVVGGVLAAEYGSIPEIGPADCSFLESVSKNATDAYSVPAPCVGPNCVAAGCIAAVKPEFYQFPSRSTLCDIIFFLINMLAVPHLIWLDYY